MRKIPAIIIGTVTGLAALFGVFKLYQRSVIKGVAKLFE